MCLSLSADFPAIQQWRPLYLVLTVIIVCSQKVDTTLSKGVLRIVASVVGGVYGKLVDAAHTLLSFLLVSHMLAYLAAS